MSLSDYVFPAAISAILTGLVLYAVARPHYVPADRIDEMIDEHTAAMSAVHVNNEALRDSLARYSAAMADSIAARDERIIAMSSVTARLRLERDSLKAEISQPVPNSWALPELPEADPDTLHYAAQFGDGLIEARSAVWLQSGQLYNDLRLTQLRDIRMVHTATKREDESIVFYTHLPDFDITGQYVYQPRIEPKRPFLIRRWREVLIFGGAVVILAR